MNEGISLVSKEEQEAQLRTIVEKFLIQCKVNGFFAGMRSKVNSPGSFFDELDDGDESPLGGVLDMFLETIEDPEEARKQMVWSEESERVVRDALQPGSQNRKIVLAYWQVDESTPWYEAANNVVGIQTFKNDDFPRQEEIDRIVSAVQS